MLVFPAIRSACMTFLFATIAASLHAQAIRFGSQQDVGAHDPFAWSVEGGDVDGDGDSDLVVGWINGTITLFSNIDGHGDFSETTSISGFDCPRLVVMDINMDAKCEIINYSCSSGGVEVLKYDIETGLFSATFSTPTYAYDIGFFDLTGDSLLELVQVLGSNGDVRVYLGQENGFSGESSYLVPNNLAFSTHTSAGDIDSDGDLDLVLSGSSGELLWVENLNGVVNGEYTSILDGGDEFEVGSLLCLDVDNNDVVDIFIGEGSNSGCRYSWLENTVGVDPVFISHLVLEDEYISSHGIYSNGELVDVDDNGEWDLLTYKSTASDLWHIQLLCFPNIDFYSDQQDNIEILSLSDEGVSLNLVDLDGDEMLDMPSWFVIDYPTEGQIGWRKNLSRCDPTIIQLRMQGESILLSWRSYGGGFMWEIHRKEHAYDPISPETLIGVTFSDHWTDYDALHEGPFYYQIRKICND